MSLAAIFTFLAVMVPGGILAEGAALLFAVIAIAASIDLFHLGRIARGFAFCTLALSLLVLLSSTGPAFVHALRSSYRF